MEDPLILESILVARRNWNNWRDVFEHGIPIDTNPLLADQTRFAFFCTEYSVGRTIRAGTQNKFRIELQRHLSTHIDDDTGRALDCFEHSLRSVFGTGKEERKRRIVSALSKVAAFVRPERFVAWDSYAKIGANLVQGRRPSFQFRAYADYLAAFDNIWSGPTGHQIRGHSGGAQHAIEIEPRFQRRILDVYLMKRGGRELSGATVTLGINK